MRILTISNYFPPHYVGGYELACFEIMTILASRGHEVRVLTSDHQRPNVGNDTIDPFPVDRLLSSGLPKVSQFDFSFSRRGRDLLDELRERRKIRKAIEQFRPDVISAWRMYDLSPAVLLACLSSEVPVVFSISDLWLPELEKTEDTWLKVWSRRSWSPRRRMLKKCMRNLLRGVGVETVLDARSLKNFHFFSKYLQNSYQIDGFLPQRSTVIYHGVDLSKYQYVELKSKYVSRILYVGRLVPEKGVHVAIRGFAALLLQGDVPGLEFHLAGSGEVAYEESLRKLVNDLGIGERVRFLGGLSRQAVSALYKDYDLLVFPSIWREPFSITLLEAMAAGLPVVGTTTGGSGEILRDGENGLVYPPEDFAALSSQMRRLIEDQDLRDRLRLNARLSVESMSNLTDNVTKIEEFLQSVKQAD